MVSQNMNRYVRNEVEFRFDRHVRPRTWEYDLFGYVRLSLKALLFPWCCCGTHCLFVQRVLSHTATTLPVLCLIQCVRLGPCSNSKSTAPWRARAAATSATSSLKIVVLSNRVQVSHRLNHRVFDLVKSRMTSAATRLLGFSPLAARTD